jgi:hypothetical protein
MSGRPGAKSKARWTRMQPRSYYKVRYHELFDYKQEKALGFFLIGIVRDDLATTNDYDIIDQSVAGL